jgi:uncharacterized damage-inducible protein DinB
MFSNLETFMSAWEGEAKKTGEVLEALPESQYDFRPDPKGRSLGELAWHLAELEAYMTTIIEKGGMGLTERPPGIERPKTIRALAPGYRRVHAEAVTRVARLGDADLDRTAKILDNEVKVRDILWSPLFCHLIHHRGQLAMLCRQAGGVVPSIYGPSREQTEEMRARAGR